MEMALFKALPILAPVDTLHKNNAVVLGRTKLGPAWSKSYEILEINVLHKILPETFFKKPRLLLCSY